MKAKASFLFWNVEKEQEVRIDDLMAELTGVKEELAVNQQELAELQEENQKAMEIIQEISEALQVQVENFLQR